MFNSVQVMVGRSLFMCVQLCPGDGGKVAVHVCSTLSR